MGWILFVEEKNNGLPVPHAWPAESTTITSNMDGYKLSCGKDSVVTDDVDFTNDFPQVLMFLHPDDEGQEGPSDGDDEE